MVVDVHVTNSEVALAVSVDDGAVTGGPAGVQTQDAARFLETAERRDCDGTLEETVQRGIYWHENYNNSNYYNYYIYYHFKGFIAYFPS